MSQELEEVSENSVWFTACAAAQHETFASLAPDTSGTTIRASLPSGLSGEAFRIVLAERYGERTIRYDNITCAVNGEYLRVRFNGETSVSIEARSTVYSDMLRLPIRSGDNVDLWLHNDTETSSTSCCLIGQTHSDCGDFCGEDFVPKISKETMPNGDVVEEKLVSVVGLQVRAPADAEKSTIVAFGDSITKMGYWVTPLREKIRLANKEYALVNCGIGGNRLLYDTHFPVAPQMQMFGLSGLARMKWDLLDLPGVKLTLLALGINDISQPRPGSMNPPVEERCTTEELIAGYRQFISRAKEAGIKVIGCTITPFGGYESFSEETEAIRVAANKWILESGEFDGIIDFASAICDSTNPAFMAKEFDSGDHLHPGEQGGNAMAEAVDLEELLLLAR